MDPVGISWSYVDGDVDEETMPALKFQAEIQASGVIRKIDVDEGSPKIFTTSADDLPLIMFKDGPRREHSRGLMRR
jgi:hypothetical protein